MFDVAIIGAGMMGSSAAKYAAKLNPGLKVCLIGPPETTVSNFNNFTEKIYNLPTPVFRTKSRGKYLGAGLMKDACMIYSIPNQNGAFWPKNQS